MAMFNVAMFVYQMVRMSPRKLYIYIVTIHSSTSSQVIFWDRYTCYFTPSSNLTYGMPTMNVLYTLVLRKSWVFRIFLLNCWLIDHVSKLNPWPSSWHSTSTNTP